MLKNDNKLKKKQKDVNYSTKYNTQTLEHINYWTCNAQFNLTLQLSLVRL